MLMHCLICCFLPFNLDPSSVQAETQARLQNAQTGLQEGDGIARPQVQQGSSVQEGVWVIDLTVDNPTATKDGVDTYMVSAALVISAVPCLLLHVFERCKRRGKLTRDCTCVRTLTLDTSKPQQDSARKVTC